MSKSKMARRIVAKALLAGEAAVMLGRATCVAHAIAAKHRIEAVSRADHRVLRPDGRIDPRRARRYYGRRNGVLVRANIGGHDIGPIELAVDRVSEAIAGAGAGGVIL